MLVLLAAIAQPVHAQTAELPPTPDRPGISVLAPVQSFALPADTTSGPIPERALDPIDDDPLASSDESPQGVDPSQLSYKPDIDTERVLATGSGVRWAPQPAGAQLRLGRAPTATAWMAGVGHFTYQTDGPVSLMLGQLTDAGSFWGEAPRLGGFQVARLPTQTSRGVLTPGTFGMTTALGFTALQSMSDPTPSSRLAFGAPVGTGSVMVGLTPDFTLASRIIAGHDSTSTGLGGIYALSDWGVVKLNAAQVQEGDTPALSSGIGMQLRWEDHALESTYQSMRIAGMTTDQRIGVNHLWDVTPQLRLQMGADRDLASGGYALRLQVSVPVDVIGKLWPK